MSRTNITSSSFFFCFFFFSAKKCEEIKTYAKSYEPNENSTWFYSNLDKYGRVSWYGTLIKIVLDNLSLILRSYFIVFSMNVAFKLNPNSMTNLLLFFCFISSYYICITVVRLFFDFCEIVYSNGLDFSVPLLISFLSSI